MLIDKSEPKKSFVKITVDYCIGESEEKYAFSQESDIFFDNVSDFLRLMDDFLPETKKKCHEHFSGRKFNNANT